MLRDVSNMVPIAMGSMATIDCNQSSGWTAPGLVDLCEQVSAFPFLLLEQLVGELRSLPT